jgi:hydrogenase expression/formation protein HypD
VNPAYEKGAASSLTREIGELARRIDYSVQYMEVCGTHTMAIHAAGIKSLLPGSVKLVSGPGCPVCVTETAFIDEAILIGREYGAALLTFGDLIRVPGASGSLADFRSEGGTVKALYSPMDSLTIAREIAPRSAVFLGVGFETTIPTIAATVKSAAAAKIDNFFVLPAFKTIHPPLKALAGKPDLHGFLLPGHVSAIIGSDSYAYLASEFHKPGVVAGFDGLDILFAVRELLRMTVEKRPEIINAYKSVVRPQGNTAALALTAEVFEPVDAVWRGLGTIPMSGLRFRDTYAAFDARTRFPVEKPESYDDPRCRCAAVITGSTAPDKCGLFGRECTPEDPVGPCMVSSEGACAAFYKYGGA